MATLKPDLTRVWANGAPPGNVVDPDTTTPGKVLSGWQAEVPPFEHFNFLQKWFTQGLAHFNEQGIGVWDTDTTYPINGLAKGSNGEVYKALVEQSGNDPVSDDGINWRIWSTISEDIVIDVPTDYALLSEAIDSLKYSRFSGNTVTINIADGNYNETDSILVNHPDGHNIRIIGNQTTPSNVTLTFPNSFGNKDGILTTSGYVLGFLDGIKVLKTSKADNTDVGTAILALNGGVIICGDKVETDNWYYGIAARNGSFVKCDNAFVDNAGDVGIWAFVGSAIQCRNATSNNASDAANPLGFGIQAEYGSTLDCEGASATGCKVAGIASLSNSNVRALSVTSNGNVGSGLLARDGATMEAHNTTANTNGAYGIEEISSGRVFGTGITLIGNSSGDYAPVAILANDSGSRILSRNGDLHLDCLGPNSVFFNTEGGPQAEVFDTPNSVNFIAQTGAATGNAPKFQSSGSDADIDLKLSPKGNGLVSFGALQALGGEVVASYIEIKDQAGVVRKLAVVA